MKPNYVKLVENTPLPRMALCRQTFAATQIDDPTAAVAEAMKAACVSKVQPGMSIAITAGSRGLANLPELLAAIVAEVRARGAHPFVVPAMGSHGGGTAQGQREVIESYGVTEEAIGCPIRSGMETVVVCQTAEGFPVHFDRHAFGADHVVVANRIKPHTRFVGDIESGLMKMMLIGLGKHAGAKVYHRAIEDYSFGQIIRRREPFFDLLVSGSRRGCDQYGASNHETFCKHRTSHLLPPLACAAPPRDPDLRAPAPL